MAAIYYLLLTTVWTVIQWFIERHYNHKVGLPYELPMANWLRGRRRVVELSHEPEIAEVKVEAKV